MKKLNLIVLYVKDLEKSKNFYKKIFNVEMKDLSSSFSIMNIGGFDVSLKSLDSLHLLSEESKTDIRGGGTELSFLISDPDELDNLRQNLKHNKVTLFGDYREIWGETFFIEDPDFHRLRFNF